MRQLLLDLFGQGAEPSPQSPHSKSNQAPALDGQAQTAINNIVHGGDATALARPTVTGFQHPQANRRIVLGGTPVAYLFRRGKRRTIGLSIGAEGLQVSAPRWTPLTEIEAALHDKARWVLAKLAEARQRQAAQQGARIDWRDGAALPYLGAPLTLRLDPRQQHGRAGAVLQSALPEGPILWLGLPASASAQQVQDVAQAWLLGQARRLFAARLDHFAPLMGVRWQRLTLSSAGTRWGSASADGSIRLNWRLIHLDAALIDYVVVHELAHLHEMNHSPRFWAWVAQACPDYLALRAALKAQAAPLW